MSEYRKDKVQSLYEAGFRELVVCGVGEVEARDDRIAELEAALTQQQEDYEEVLRDHRRLVRELDALINGEDGAAKQASLCDIVGQLQERKRQQQEAEPVGACVAAIQYALETDDGLIFLRLWNEGEFDAIRKEWLDVPESVFIGADPLHPATPKPAAQPKVPKWISVGDRVPLENEGPVMVLLDDGTCGVAWAAYWHGARRDFAKWVFPDPEEERQPLYWMPFPPSPLSAAKEGGK